MGAPGRRLQIDGGVHDTSDFACERVNYDATDQRACAAYEALPTSDPAACSAKAASRVPKLLHATGDANLDAQRNVRANAALNPQYVLNYRNDAGARSYVAAHCGEQIAQAYDCLTPGAFRADLFRFCAMYAEGGVYMDTDLVALKPLEEIYSPCSDVSIGHDWPWDGSNASKQMKFLASAPGAPIFKCALDSIVRNVKARASTHPLRLTGPLMLQQCYQNHSAGVAVTYTDTRQAVWPYTGLRRGAEVLMYESHHSPSSSSVGHARLPYETLVEQHRVYSAKCVLR